MKCPYREFKDCLVEQCPSCNYKEETKKVLCGRCPTWMNQSEALACGILWHETRSVYQFISCKLIENGVQPTPTINQTVNNSTQTKVVVKKSVF
jgi:hypothetical protein